MPKLMVDGIEVEVPQGTKVIEAAKKAGMEIPFYCYHPGLSIAGNCRMCLVEIEKIPKLQIACHTVAQDGMIVHTNTEKVKATRKHVLEFLLVNHPVDCPVCDQAGECWLQDFYVNYGAYESRLNENKTKKKKAQPIGPHVMLDQERCILCSRCVRFTDEISKTHELGITERGDHSEINLFPGMELNNKYSGNVVDLCPVGALTDRDFRFKMRVWYLKNKDSICAGCSKGCNIQVHYRDQRFHHANGERVMRLKPRFHPTINHWWMCDEGRYGYKYHDLNRISEPIIRKSKQVWETDWEQIYDEVLDVLKISAAKTAVLLSGQLSNEELYLAKKLFKEELKIPHILLLSPKEDGFGDDFLMQTDKNPNSKGAKQLGLDYDLESLKKVFEKCNRKEIKGLVVFGQDILSLHEAHLGQNQLDMLDWMVFIGSNHHLTSEYAMYTLPSATYFEKEGTFTNCDGITQKFNQVLAPFGEARPEWQILTELGRRMGTKFPYEDAEDVFDDMAKHEKTFKGLSYSELMNKETCMAQMAMPLIPVLEQDSKLIFYDAQPNQKTNILDKPKAEQTV